MPVDENSSDAVRRLIGAAAHRNELEDSVDRLEHPSLAIYISRRRCARISTVFLKLHKQLYKLYQLDIVYI